MDRGSGLCQNHSLVTDGTISTGRRQIACCPTAVLFDFGGTLDAPAVTWKERMRDLFRAEGMVICAERFDPAFHRADDAMVGSIPRTLPFDATVRRLVRAVATALGVDDAALTERITERFVVDAVTNLHARRPLLARLATRYGLGIVSNFYGNLDTVCAETGLGSFFSVIVDSAAVGASKPDPRIFRHALDTLGVEPSDATFVGDSMPRDMAGARGIAMPHIWLIGQAVREATPCCPRDPVIRSLDELEGLLL